jgi:hypothetical protein
MGRLTSIDDVEPSIRLLSIWRKHELSARDGVVQANEDVQVNVEVGCSLSRDVECRTDCQDAVVAMIMIW